ncbi:MAG: 2TM domain-containing protein [Actinobacteria bacterium]|nr:2TM domain-containing protein [Actinomycetota bacterium]
MTETQDEQELRTKAEKRVEEKIGFRQNLIAYLAVNALIFVIWLVVALFSDTWFPWFLFPLAGWGIGVAFHGWAVYGEDDQKQEERVQREMEKLKAGK